MTAEPRSRDSTELHRGGSLMRLRGLVRKEFVQVLRDPSALAIAFVLPVILLLLLGSSLFLLTALGMGLFISTVTRVQFVAAQVAILATFLPAFILSGFIFDIGSMPRPIQWITHIVPARYYVSILKTVFLAGDVWSVILPNSAALAVMATIFLGLTRWLSQKRLD